jgi:hypothetical protein
MEIRNWKLEREEQEKRGLNAEDAEGGAQRTPFAKSLRASREERGAESCGPGS